MPLVRTHSAGHYLTSYDLGPTEHTVKGKLPQGFIAVCQAGETLVTQNVKTQDVTPHAPRLINPKGS